jgi:hypothetical protein
MPKHRIFAMAFAKVYPLYVQKAERKDCTKEEVDRIICWLTGYDQSGLRRQIAAWTSWSTSSQKERRWRRSCGRDASD